MDLLSELDGMARNIVEEADDLPGPSDAMVIQWQNLFQRTHAETVSAIQQHRNNLSRKRVSDEHWEIVGCAKEADGYDREACEDEMEIRQRRLIGTCSAAKTGLSVSQASSRSTFILKLEGLLDTAAKVQEAANLESPPAVKSSIGESGEASFVEVDAIAKDAIILLLSKEHTRCSPTFIRISKSAKELSPHSMYPTLGVDSMLPQYRPDSADATFLPAQDQYPVW